MENNAIYDRIEDLEVDVKNVVSSVDDISDEVYDLWLYQVGAKPGEAAIYATASFPRVLPSSGDPNTSRRPSSTTKLCDISGSGILYAVVVASDVDGNHYIKLTIDGKTAEIIGPYRENSQMKYVAYYASQSLSENVLPAQGISTTVGGLLTGGAELKTRSEVTAGGLEIWGTNLCTTLPLEFKESLVVEVAYTDSASGGTAKASACYALTA